MPETMVVHADHLVVRDKYTGDEIASLPQLTVEQTLDVIAESDTATAVAAAMPRHQRAAILEGQPHCCTRDPRM